MQANNYCKWRTDRVNEYILIREGILLWNNDQQNEPFTTGAYLTGQFSSSDNPRGQLLDLDPSNGSGWSNKRKDLATRIVKIQDGILLPKYRLPTAAEWEYASAAPTTKIGTKLGYKKKRIHKNKDVASNINPPLNGQITEITSIDAYWPNDYGLYNMNGNVSEWVMDAYMTGNEVSDFSPFSGKTNILTEVINSKRFIAQKSNETIYDIPKIIEYTRKLKEVTIRNKSGVITDSLNLWFFDRLEEKLSVILIQWKIDKKLDASRSIHELIEQEIPQYRIDILKIGGFEDF